MIGQTPNDSPESRPADAVPDGWVDRFLPSGLRPWARLMRLDRPIGVWLLMWPCWWSVVLALPHRTVPSYLLTPEGRHYVFDVLWFLGLFAIGALVLRAAGCIVNDLWDRKIDAKVARTAGRPIASGAISPIAAFAVLVLLGLMGLAILVQLPLTTIILALLSVPLIIVYPLAKRVTYWPQVVLGIVFNWGALLGWSAMDPSRTSGIVGKAGWDVMDQIAAIVPGWPALVLYAGCIFWTLGYDTIYAHMDKEDDVTAGVKSSALALGDRTKPFLWMSYGVALALWALAGTISPVSGLSWPYYVSLGLGALYIARLLLRLDIDDSGSCLHTFRANARFGWIIFLAILAGWY